MFKHQQDVYNGTKFSDTDDLPASGSIGFMSAEFSAKYKNLRSDI